MNIDPIDLIIDGDSKTIEILQQSSKSLNEEYLNDFLVETKEHIESIETNTLILEKDRENVDIINGIFRDFHTIKGLAGFVSQGLVQTIAHQTESILDQCRRRERSVTDKLIQYILTSSDYVKNICENLDLNKDKAFITKAKGNVYQEDSYEPETAIVTKEKKSKEDATYVRIPIKKIDFLIEMVGELVMARGIQEA